MYISEYMCCPAVTNRNCTWLHWNQTAWTPLLMKRNTGRCVVIQRGLCLHELVMMQNNAVYGSIVYIIQYLLEATWQKLIWGFKCTPCKFFTLTMVFEWKKVSILQWKKECDVSHNRTPIHSRQNQQKKKYYKEESKSCSDHTK